MCFLTLRAGYEFQIDFNAFTGLEVKAMGSELHVELQLDSVHKHGPQKGWSYQEKY